MRGQRLAVVLGDAVHDTGRSAKGRREALFRVERLWVTGRGVVSREEGSLVKVVIDP